MALNSDDYEGVRTHLLYGYSELDRLKGYLDKASIIYGSDWETALQALLLQLTTAKGTMTTAIASGEYKRLKIDDEYEVENFENTGDTYAAKNHYNLLRNELILLTGIPLNSISSKITRGN